MTKNEDDMKLIAFAFLMFFSAVAAFAESSKTIKSGNCGGIRGGCRGYEIHSDGTIFNTESGPGAEEKKRVICKNKKTVELLFEKLNKMHFTDVKMNETGNITTFISLETEGTKHQVSWWRKDETTNALNQFMEEELQLLREINCTGYTQ
jgi:hypothetical protein